MLESMKDELCTSLCTSELWCQHLPHSAFDCECGVEMEKNIRVSSPLTRLVLLSTVTSPNGAKATLLSTSETGDIICIEKFPGGERSFKKTGIVS